MGFNYWNKHFGNLILGSRSYLTGKQGILPDWQLKGKGVKEIFAPQQYFKAGKMVREGITKRSTALATGTFGIGAVEYAQGKEGWFPDWGRPGQFPKTVDTSGGGKGLINIEIPEIPKIVIPPFPKIPEIPDFPEMPNVDLSGIGTGIAQGLAALGSGLGGGMPSMPSMELVDDEGTPNILVIGGLGLIAYTVLKKVK